MCLRCSARKVDSAAKEERYEYSHLTSRSVNWFWREAIGKERSRVGAFPAEGPKEVHPVQVASGQPATKCNLSN